MPRPADPLSATLRRTRRRLAWAGLADASFVAATAVGVVGGAAWAAGADAVLPVGVAAVVGFAAVWRPPFGLARVAAWLDRRHGTADLLSTAWATQHDRGAWAAAVRSRAAACVARLPAVGRVARFPVRRHACVWALSAAAWVAVGLVVDRPRPDEAAGRSSARAARPAAAVDVADVRRRAGNTAEDAVRPGVDGLGPPATPPAATATASARPTGGDDALGTGRANAPGSTSLPRQSPRTPPADVAGPDAIGGPGRAAASGERPGGEAVTVDRGPTPARDGPAESGGGPRRVPRDVAAVANAVPGEYRDLVRDFFTP